MDTVEYDSDETGTTVTMTKKEKKMSDSIKNIDENGNRNKYQWVFQ